jgi:hypothetical protein
MPSVASAFVAEMLWTNKNRRQTSAIQAGINLRDIVMSYFAPLWLGLQYNLRSLGEAVMFETQNVLLGRNWKRRALSYRITRMPYLS